MQSEHGQDVAFKKSNLNYYNFNRSKQLICIELYIWNSEQIQNIVEQNQKAFLVLLLGFSSLIKS